MTKLEDLRWFPTTAPPASSRYDDIWFINSSMGWAVNSNGQILKTSDGGANWDQQFQTPLIPPLNRAVYLRCVGFATPLKGWVGTVTAEQRLYQTTDGGQTWTVVENLPEEAPVKICGLSVVNESVVYASGTNDPRDVARMMKTVDGGATWTAWDMSEHASNLIDVYFFSPDCGWVVGGMANASCPPSTGQNPRDNLIPVVLYTSDGGKTWENRVENIRSSFSCGEWGWKIQFLNDQIGFVSLENLREGAILKTTDGGKTWKRLPINDPQGNANLEGIGFVDEKHGWVGGWGDANFQGGFTSQTNNGGKNWEDANQIGRFINRFRFFGDPVTIGYSAGRTVYKYSTEPVAVSFALEAIPTTFLRTNRPEKFERSVTIEYTVPENTRRVTLHIWDQFAVQVCKLIDESNPEAGPKSVVWDGTNDEGESLPPGIFIYRLTVDGNAESRVIRLQS